MAACAMAVRMARATGIFADAEDIRGTSIGRATLSSTISAVCGSFRLHSNLGGFDGVYAVAVGFESHVDPRRVAPPDWDIAGCAIAGLCRPLGSAERPVAADRIFEIERRGGTESALGHRRRWRVAIAR